MYIYIYIYTYVVFVVLLNVRFLYLYVMCQFPVLAFSILLGFYMCIICFSLSYFPVVGGLLLAVPLRQQHVVGDDKEALGVGDVVALAGEEGADHVLRLPHAVQVHVHRVRDGGRVSLLSRKQMDPNPNEYP